MVGANRKRTDQVLVFYGLFVHLPVLASASLTIVYAVRSLANMDCFPVGGKHARTAAFRCPAARSRVLLASLSAVVSWHDSR